MKSYCTEFTKTFKNINTELIRTDNRGFDYCILLIYLNELDKNFKVKKINKTTNKGTTVSYIPIKNNEDAERYREMLDTKLEEFNTKWDEQLKLDSEQ